MITAVYRPCLQHNWYCILSVSSLGDREVAWYGQNLELKESLAILVSTKEINEQKRHFP